jgi:hypothetical protein
MSANACSGNNSAIILGDCQVVSRVSIKEPLTYRRQVLLRILIRGAPNFSGNRKGFGCWVEGHQPTECSVMITCINDVGWSEDQQPSSRPVYPCQPWFSGVANWYLYFSPHHFGFGVLVLIGIMVKDDGMLKWGRPRSREKRGELAPDLASSVVTN